MDTGKRLIVELNKKNIHKNMRLYKNMIKELNNMEQP